MTRLWKSLATAIIFSIFGLIRTARSSGCLSYSKNSTCNLLASCSWETYNNSDPSDDLCVCNTTVNQAVSFVMDSSGSVQTDGWANEKTFVSDMLSTGISRESIVGVVVFSNYAYQLWEFHEDQDRSVISEAVNNAGFIASTTYTRTAINTALDLYSDPGAADISGLPRLMMLITDGVPVPGLNQNPCLEYDDIWCYYRDADNNRVPTPCPIPLVQPYLDVAEDTRIRLDEENVTVIIIGVGTQWSPEVLECLVDDPVTQIIKSDSFDESDLNAIRAQTDTFLCPATIQITISELRVNESKPSGFADDQAFVEVYNRGDPWDLAGQNLILEGFLNCTIDNGEWFRNQYLVIYDGEKAKPICEQCECEFLEEDEDWCKDSIYINATEIDDCVFDYSMSNEKWSQSGTDQTLITGDEYYFDISYDEINGDGFEDGAVGVIDGFTYTVKRYYRSLQSARNWQPSCTEFGTPGAPPILNCSITCFPGSCTANGDVDGECSSNNRYCLCTADDHFYPSGPRCLPLPPPENCRIFAYKFDQSSENVTEWNNRAIWDPAPLDDTHQYQFEYSIDDEKLVRDSEKVTVDYYDPSPLEYDTPRVRTSLFTRNKWYYSEWITCEWITESPTTAPTLSPTHTYPDVDCDVSVRQGTTNEFDITWDQVNLTGPLTPSDNSSFYRIHFYYEGEYYSRQDIARLKGRDNWDEEYSYTYNPGADVDITDPLNQVNFTMIYEVIELDGYIWDTDELLDGAKVCSISSFAPTMNPTANPTGNPTENPTAYPTENPTATPTIRSIVITDCQVYVIPGTTNQVNFTWTLDRDGRNTEVEIKYDWDEGTEIALGDQDDNGAAGVAKTVTDAASRKFFWVYPVYKLYPTASATSFKHYGQNCTLVSVSPTMNPTKFPSMAPSKYPTTDPTENPTKFPTSSPTMSPTYTQVAIVNCTYSLKAFASQADKDNGIVRAFDLVIHEAQFREGDFEDDLEYPLRTDSEYFVDWENDNRELNPVESNSKTEFNFQDEEISVDSTMTVLVRLIDSGVALGEAVVCIPSSLSPTAAPVGPFVTPAPTFESPVVYWEPDFEDREICEPSTGLIDDTEIWEYRLCEVVEQSEKHEFHISVSPSDFGPDILVAWEVVFEDPIFEGRLPDDVEDAMSEEDESQRSARMASYDDFFDLEGLSLIVGANDANGGNGGEAEVGVFKESETRRRLMEDALQKISELRQKQRRLLQDDDENDLEIVDLDSEFAYLNLINCTVVTDTDGVEYPCAITNGTVEDKPSVLLLEIPNSDALTGGGGRDPIPWWIWLIVAGAAIIVLLGALVGYRIWNKRKFSEMALAEREAELAQLEAEGDEGLPRDRGMSTNPMATGGTMDLQTTGDMIEQRRTLQMANNEWADVETENMQFQDTMGQILPTTTSSLSMGEMADF